MKKFQYIIPIILGLGLVGQTSWAAKAYVTDTFKITLRTGPSVQNKVIAMLSSGQLVEVLKSQNEWSRVRLLDPEENNIEGWVRTNYLVSRVPWELQVKALKKENDRLKEKLKGIENELAEMTTQEQEHNQELQKSTGALKSLQNDHESLRREAAEYLELKTKHEAVSEQLITIQRTADTLTKENQKLRSSQRIKWFATGAMVILGGLIIGLVLGSKQKKRKSLYY